MTCFLYYFLSGTKSQCKSGAIDNVICLIDVLFIQKHGWQGRYLERKMFISYRLEYLVSVAIVQLQKNSPGKCVFQNFSMIYLIYNCDSFP